MSVLVHHHPGGRDHPTRTGTLFKALLTLVLVTAVVATGAGLAAYLVSQVLVGLMR